MKWAVSLLCCLNLAAAAELTGARTVYLMPMGHGLDQFIANRLTRMHVLRVVTDPAKADIIFTDEVGAALEDRLNDLYPLPLSPEAQAAAAEKAAAKEAAAKEKTDKPGAYQAPGPGSLLDVQSRDVLWSVFEKPKNSNPRELDHTAERVVKQLKEDLSPKTK
jgi:hypothetical protein